MQKPTRGSYRTQSKLKNNEKITQKPLTMDDPVQVPVRELKAEFSLIPRLHDTTGCQTRCQTGLTTGCIVYTNIQPFDNRLYRVYSRLSNRLSNRL